MRQTCKTATDANGQTVRRGDKVEALDIHTREWTGRVVTVVDMWKQGADGTIVETDPAPVADYPHHYSHRASRVRKVTATEGRL